jgi:hypothetical protein
LANEKQTVCKLAVSKEYVFISVGRQ